MDGRILYLIAMADEMANHLTDLAGVGSAARYDQARQQVAHMVPSVWNIDLHNRLPNDGEENA